ncbi:hypothetical protein, partial [Phocaeicola dorei]|uniref:hypothetical protein n=1 Tax=Phocaeicola dorei TaxID=357276 RepID=UPI0034A51B5B
IKGDQYGETLGISLMRFSIIYAAVNIRRKVIHGGFDFYLLCIQLFFCVLVGLSSFLSIFAVGT